MKNQYSKSHRRSNRSNRSSPQQIFRYTILDSTGPMGKLRGTPLQLAEKYKQASKDAQAQGDEILTQTYLQYADHYFRIQNIAIENEQRLKVKVTESMEEESSCEEQVEEKEELISEPEVIEPLEIDSIDPSILPPAAE